MEGCLPASQHCGKIQPIPESERVDLSELTKVNTYVACDFYNSPHGVSGIWFYCSQIWEYSPKNIAVPILFSILFPHKHAHM